MEMFWAGALHGRDCKWLAVATSLRSEFIVASIRTHGRDRGHTLVACWLRIGSTVVTSPSVGCTSSLPLLLYCRNGGHLWSRL